MSPCSLLVQAPGKAVDADLGAHEDDRLLRVLGLQHLREGVWLLAVRHLDVELFDGVDGQRGGAHPNRHGVVHELLGKTLDLRGDRRREKSGLAALRAAAEDGLDVLQESEVEHLVGLVEDHEARLVEVQVVPVDHVQHAPDGADHDLGAPVQPRGLVADGSSPEDRHHLDAAGLPIRAQRLRHLDAQLPGGGQHERLDVRVSGIHELEHRKPEGGGLAGACLCLPDHVAAVAQSRDGLLLDRGGALVAEVRERLQQRRRDP
jgi:hypothetical protein